MKDYKDALIGTCTKPDRNKSIVALESFFRSQWFGVLTSIDGEAIIKEYRTRYGYFYSPPERKK